MALDRPNRPAPQKKARLWLWSILALISIAGGGIGGWILLSSAQNDEIIVLRSPGDTFRVRPVDRGGKQVSHQNSQALSLLDTMNPESNDVETLALPEPDPELPPVPVQSSEAELSDAQTQGTASDTELSESDNIIVADRAGPVSEDTSQPKQTDEQTDSDEAVSDGADNSNAVIQPTPRPERAASPKRAPAPSSEQPLFTIQLAAFQSQEKAENAAALLNQKHTSRLNGVRLGVTRSENIQGAIFWRVTSEPVEKEDAELICDRLRRAGQDCLTKKAENL